MSWNKDGDMCYFYDEFCKAYWNHKRREWQRKLDWDCAMKPDETESKAPNYRSDDIVIRRISSAWLAA